MIRCFLSLALLLSAFHTLAAETPQTAPPEPPQMKSIFNGENLDGWDGDPRLWSVVDGAIHGETTEENAAKGNTFLIWKGGRTKDFDPRHPSAHPSLGQTSREVPDHQDGNRTHRA